MKITPHFNREEFDCHDGAKYPERWINTRLMVLCTALEKIRGLTGQRMTILSGYRTPSWNKKVGGVPDSQHLKGSAADIVLAGINPFQLGHAIDRLTQEKVIPQGGIGIYKTFVHYDIRGKKARWGLWQIKNKKTSKK